MLPWRCWSRTAFGRCCAAIEAQGMSTKPAIDGKALIREAAWRPAPRARRPRSRPPPRHICIEGWSAIGKWSGVRFSDFLTRIGADQRARYVTFKCADGYSTSLDMATVLHPQTQLTLRF